MEPRLIKGNTAKIVIRRADGTVEETPEYPNYLYLENWVRTNQDPSTFAFVKLEYWPDTTHDDIVNGQGTAGVDVGMGGDPDWHLPFWWGYEGTRVPCGGLNRPFVWELTQTNNTAVNPYPNPTTTRPYTVGRTRVKEIGNPVATYRYEWVSVFGWDLNKPNRPTSDYTFDTVHVCGNFLEFWPNSCYEPPRNEIRESRYRPADGTRFCVIKLDTPVTIGPLDQFEIYYKMDLYVDDSSFTGSIPYTIDGVPTTVNYTAYPCFINIGTEFSNASNFWSYEPRFPPGDSIFDSGVEFSTKTLPIGNIESWYTLTQDTSEPSATTRSVSFSWVRTRIDDSSWEEHVTILPQTNLVSPGSGWRSLFFRNRAGCYHIVFDSPIVIAENQTFEFKWVNTITKVNPLLGV